MSKIYIVIWENGQSYEEYSESITNAYISRELAEKAIILLKEQRDKQLIDCDSESFEIYYLPFYNWRIEERDLIDNI